MIDFSTLQGLEIAEGEVVQIEDSAGNVLWAVQSNEPVVLQVEKKSITSYAGETSYSDNCVLLDIYPKKSDSEIKVTYGGLTKTLTFSGINAMQVYFGTFNGVSDSVATPASGTLTIEGACDSFACGVYQNGSKTTNQGYCSCVAAVDEFGSITKIAPYAFYNCTNLALTELPSGITSIGNYAFYDCTSLVLTSLPSGITSIGSYAFYACENLTLTSLPNSITSLGSYAFQDCSNLALTSLPNITIIPDHAFDGCTSLTITALPKVTTSIGKYAFYEFGYNGLKDRITLPSSLYSIGECAFTHIGSNSYVPGVRNYVILATTPPTLGGFQDADAASGGRAYSSAIGYQTYIESITVPKGCGAVYKAAEGWSNYADKIVEAS